MREEIMRCFIGVDTQAQESNIFAFHEGQIVEEQIVFLRR